MKPTVFVLILLVIGYAFPGNTQPVVSFRDRGYCGTPYHQITSEYISHLFTKTAGLVEPGRHFLPKVYSVGESAPFYTYNFVDEKFQQITATLRVTADNINIWVEDTEWNNFHVTEDDVQGILNGLLFSTPSGSSAPDSGIIFIVQNHFGQPPDFDGDGITDFLITDIKDGWKENEPFIAGYFNPVDQYKNGSTVGGSLITGSNERDILYIDSYPGIFNQTDDHYEDVLATVAHEFQHLIQYRYDRNEDVWINEGLSELSSYLCGYGLRNPSPYLLDTGLDLTSWDNTTANALKHYAKAALWTYYLYEKLGANLIRRIAQSSLPGIPGINSALSGIGQVIGFNDLLPDFFIAVALNDIRENNLYGFELAQLTGLQAVPQNAVVEYPWDKSVQQAAYSLQQFSLENGDSLHLQFFSAPSAGALYLIKKSADGTLKLEPISGNTYQDTEFGSGWYKEQLMSINSGAGAAVLAFNARAAEKYYITNLTYATTTTADLNIQTTGVITANQFVAPYDNCLLKSVSFNNVQSNGRVRIHVYQQSLQKGNNPDEYVTEFANILESAWTSIDLENLQVLRNKDETFDVGIEFVDDGVMGYARTPTGLNRSFLKRSSDATFFLLSDFKAGNETLNGIWLIRIDINAPLDYKPETPDNSKLPYTIDLIGPTPFPTPGNSNLRIQYTIEKPGKVKIEIYDILGRKVTTIFDGYDQGPIAVHWWNGTNGSRRPVASGQYFLRFSYNGFHDVRKIMLLR